MALDPKLATAAANAAADAVVDLVDAGAAAGKVRIYSAGSGVPGTANTAITDQVLLAELTMSDPAFGSAAGGVATANAISNDTSADATGTAAFFRVLDSNNNVVFQGTVGTASADMILNTTSIVAGAIVSISSFTYTQPLG